MRRLPAFVLLTLIACLARADMASVVPVPNDPAVALQVPADFSIQAFARVNPAGGGYFRGPRFMAFGPDGNLYLSLGLDNKVVMLPDRDHDGRADEIATVADKLNGPQGLVFVEGMLYVANQDGVVRLEQGDGKWPATALKPVVANLPTGGHTMKTLKLGPDGLLYLNVGSSCNVCEESDPLRATLLRYSVDGKPAGALPSVGRHPSSPIFASGLRNTQGFAWHPATGALYATNNGADMRSDTKGGKPVDDLPPEHLNLIAPGKHYGWPHCWGDRVTDPNFPGAAGFCAGTQPPALTLPAHSTPIGIAFLDQSGFPQEYRDDALVALHGSWNRQQPSGYKVVRVHFEQGKPVSVSDFVTGWLENRSAWGRPVDIAVGPDGAAYISDDRAGMIYRIVYRKGAGQ
ncbi:MAG TPA: PQQ-dependent sugar dehydrogenase [Methylophilaceae bacterium]|nr:PQQ-dependent sugar dehydrogenase [Methylophilaceae bacterium]